MRRIVVLAAGLAGMAALVIAWNRWTRIGTGFANDVVNPWLVERGIPASSNGELVVLEHVGRRSGIRRLTPLHAIPEPDGVRFPVPLGDRSEWARNVLAAGHCRMQMGDEVVELDEPRLLDPADVAGMHPALARAVGLMGWKYLSLRRFSSRPGSLAGETAEAARIG